MTLYDKVERRYAVREEENTENGKVKEKEIMKGNDVLKKEQEEK